MTPTEVQLIRDSFRRIAPIAEQAAALFYARLFELNPALRSLFPGDMTEQGRKLMQMIGLAVGGLDRLDQLVPTIRALGLRHAGYHVRDDHYDSVGEALLWTLERGLGPEFTPATHRAWAKVYSLLAETMKAGARDGALQRQRIAV